MQLPELIRAQFAEMVSRRDEDIDLARAAMLIAAESEPGLDVDAELARLESWAAELGRRIDPAWNSLQRLARLRNFMFDELGFRGDVRHYHSPLNSLLHSVMKRRLGIPLTLGIVFMELGWRIGVPFEGVGFPSHFLVRLTGLPGDLLLDAYDHGTSVHEEDCHRMLAASTRGMVAYDASMIRSIGRREMIARLLYGLKVSSLRAGNPDTALAAVERLLIMHPEDALEQRDRGLLLYRLDRYRDARDALRLYLDRRPEALDREVIERTLAAIEIMLVTRG